MCMWACMYLCVCVYVCAFCRTDFDIRCFPKFLSSLFTGARPLANSRACWLSQYSYSASLGILSLPPGHEDHGGPPAVQLLWFELWLSIWLVLTLFTKLSPYSYIFYPYMFGWLFPHTPSFPSFPQSCLYLPNLSILPPLLSYHTTHVCVLLFPRRLSPHVIFVFIKLSVYRVQEARMY